MIKKILMCVMMMCFVAGGWVMNNSDAKIVPETIEMLEDRRIREVAKMHRERGKEVMKVLEERRIKIDNRLRNDDLIGDIITFYFNKKWIPFIEGKEFVRVKGENTIAVSKSFIKRLGKSGIICKVFGHQWECVRVHTVKSEKDPIYLYIPGFETRFPYETTFPSNNHRRCKICGRKEVKKESWEVE